MKIVLAAGGSGGHLLPAQQLADSLLYDADILFAGFKLDRSPFFLRGQYHYETIASAPVSFTPKGLFFFAKEMTRGVFQSLHLLRKFQPDVVVGFGSFHSFPVLLAAMILRKKIVLFEANCYLGKVNRFFSRDAHFIAAQFSIQKKLKNIRSVSLLPWCEPQKTLEKKEAKEKIGFDPKLPAFLIFGGSQGAAFLNRSIPLVLPSYAQAIHLTGRESSVPEVAQEYQKRGILARVMSFEPNMHELYAAADYAICRAGAGTLAELIRTTMPALLIPFPGATDDHQRINAEFLAKKIGGARMVVERDADSQRLNREIDELIREADLVEDALKQYRQECDGRISMRELILDIL